MSSFAGGDLEGSVSNGKSLGIVSPAPSFSSRKPPLPSSHRKRSGNDMTSASVHGSRTGCHCCKRRYRPELINKNNFYFNKICCLY